jgi:hypothetical protein
LRVTLTVSNRDIANRSATVMDFNSNAFCASGAHYPNGTFMTFGGNGAITVGGNLGSQPYVCSSVRDTTCPN